MTKNLQNYFLIFCALIVFTVMGCTTEFNLATQKQETLMYSSEKEVKIGDKIAPKIEARYDIVTDVDVNEQGGGRVRCEQKLS